MSHQNPDRRRAARRAAATGLVGLAGLSAAVAVPALAADGEDEPTQVFSDAPTTSQSTTTTTLSPEAQAIADFAQATPEQQQFILWMSLTEEERTFIMFVSATEEQRAYIAFVSAPEEQRAAFVNAFAPPPAPRSQPAPQSQSAATVSGGGSVWDSLAQCEASGNWSINNGNGYSGGLQFAHSTWTGFGGGEFAPMAYQATREQQIVVAERVLASQGWGAWPGCTRKLGLR